MIFLALTCLGLIGLTFIWMLGRPGQVIALQVELRAEVAELADTLPGYELAAQQYHVAAFCHARDARDDPRRRRERLDRAAHCARKAAACLDRAADLLSREADRKLFIVGEG